MTGELHRTRTAATPWQRSLLVLVGMLLLAAGVVGYVALQNELSYRTFMRDPVRVEADMLSGEPSGRFGYAVRYRFRVDNLINTGRIHVSEDDWQWISSSKKVPVVYARDNPRLFDADPESYREAALREARLCVFLLMLALAILIAGQYVRFRKPSSASDSVRRATPGGLAFAGLIVALIGTLLAAASVRSAKDHHSLQSDMQIAEGEVIRTWHVSVGKRGHKLGMRLRLPDRTVHVEAPNRNWNHVKVGEQVSLYYSASRPHLFSLSPTLFRNDAILFAFGALFMIALLLLIRRDYRKELAVVARLAERHAAHRGATP